MPDETRDEDPTRLLATRARLIAEDDTHVVFAVRISKQLIKDNLLLLTSAMEAALDQPERCTS